jgi:isoleucyl-tRNA synthetase
MEGYYLYNVVPPTLGFIDHLTNWYVRRSRRRFWRARGESGAADSDKLAAFATLHEVLTTFIEVLAPVLPFITEHLYQDLVARHDPDAVSSVHHRDFPRADSGLIDTDLEASMRTVREVVRLGRNLRKKEGHRVRQPLAELTVLTHDSAVVAAINLHAGIISDELNIKKVSATSYEAELVDLSAKANYRKLGPELGSRMQEVANGIADLNPVAIESLLDGDTLDVAGRQVTLEDVLIERTPKEGTIVESGPVFACALDTTLTEELITEGLAREIISKVQRLRRETGLEVTDRIRLVWNSPDGEIARAVDSYREQIAAEVLASDLVNGDSSEGEPTDINGHTIWLTISKQG